MAIDPATANEIRAEEQQRDEPCPVLTPEGLAQLESIADRARRGAIEVVRMFAGGEKR